VLRLSLCLCVCVCVCARVLLSSRSRSTCIQSSRVRSVAVFLLLSARFVTCLFFCVYLSFVSSFARSTFVLTSCSPTRCSELVLGHAAAQRQGGGLARAGRVVAAQVAFERANFETSFHFIAQGLKPGAFQDYGSTAFKLYRQPYRVHGEVHQVRAGP
jgi:hypothetical protein